MTIGSNIKKLRRERDITQEQLAEFLHLPPSAISQWETDRVLPDIQYIPKIAHLFKVSSDVILGINVEVCDEEINRIYKEVRELWCTARRSEAEKLCREGIDSYPNAYILMEELAFNLSYDYALLIIFLARSIYSISIVVLSRNMKRRSVNEQG